jgi:hypothetical protein
MSIKKSIKNKTHDVGVQFFMQKVKWLSIYIENKAMRYKIKLKTRM